MNVGPTSHAQGNGNVYDAVFTDKTDNAQMDQMDFINLLVTQMQNQDFTNPMDNSDMIDQMATFSNMQQMEQMATYSKTSYALSLVGKTVTASRFSVDGDLDSTTGSVQKVSLVDNEFILYIGGKKYTLEQIMSVETGQSSQTDSAISSENYPLEITEIKSDSATVNWQVPTEDEQISSGLTYTVYYSENENFDTVEAVENGIQFGAKDIQGVDSLTIIGLKPNTQYYFNVVVTTKDGQKSVYKPMATKTLS